MCKKELPHTDPWRMPEVRRGAVTPLQYGRAATAVALGGAGGRAGTGMAVSTFTWLDHHDEDAQRVREALGAFDEKGMIDPLGFGPVRDALSDILFPGVSTIQTRARYFLLVPWIYRSLDDEGIGPHDGARVARERELAVIEALLRGGDDHDGIIGRFARQATKQLPSFVYWGGLGTWGVRRFDGSRYDYMASLGARRLLRRSRTVNVDGVGDGDSPGSGAEPWHPGLPPQPDDLYDAATLDLTPDEALFLQGRILDTVPDTYLALLVRDGRSDQSADMPWQHPLAPAAPPNLRRQLDHAGLFSLAAWGAGLVYNLELSRLLEHDGGEPLPADYSADVEKWTEAMAEQGDQYAAWDRRDFWRLILAENPRVPGSVRRFVDWWLDLAVEHALGRATAHNDVTASRRIRDELRNREAAIKGPRAKLANRRARERSPGAQGDVQLGFRWRQVGRVIGDIQRGLESDAQPA